MALVYHNLDADEVIENLDLKPHPEGGAFREVYLSEERMTRSDGTERPVGTSIYFLLRRGDVSSWHRVASDEIWHFYVGAPLVLEAITPRGEWRKIDLGGDLKNAECPQALIPGGSWQRAWSTDAWTLVGCTVIPGFDFDDFDMIEPEELAEKYPAVKDRILYRPFE